MTCTRERSIMAETFTLYKLIVLYMLDRVDFPLTTSQISEFILDKGYTTYFRLQSALAELTDSGLLKWYELKTIHKKDDSTSDYIFEMFEESDGTSRLFDFIPMLIDMRANDAVYVIDEVDRSLHPMLTLKLLEMYNSLLRSDSQMQLICTTHESNLLSTAPIRQDEVWFVEKDKRGESHLSSLCEYKPRENVQKGYLNGRYGAIPFFGELNNIHWDDAK